MFVYELQSRKGFLGKLGFKEKGRRLKIRTDFLILDEGIDDAGSNDFQNIARLVSSMTARVEYFVNGELIAKRDVPYMDIGKDPELRGRMRWERPSKWGNNRTL